MRFGLGCAALAITLGGCFSDPPSSSSSSDGGSSTSDTAGASSTAAADASTSSGAQTSSSSGVLDGSTTFGTTGAVCELEPFEPEAVPADVVLLLDIDAEPDLLNGFIDALQMVGVNNVAVLAPEAQLADLTIESDCPDGCDAETCKAPSNRVTVPYTGSAYGALANRESFDCVFRLPAAETSGPVAHLWFITQAPEQMPPMDLAAIVLQGDVSLRVHVACPGCDDDLFNANALLKEVVATSGGTVSDTNDTPAVLAQAGVISAQRHSCAWAAGDDPAFYAFEPPGELELFFADPVDERADCPGESVLDTGFGAYHPNEFGVALCPETCKLVQTFPRTTLDVSACF